MSSGQPYIVADAYSKLLTRARCRLFVDLHPSKLASIVQGIKEYLNGLLLRYNEDVDGVVISYSNEKILSQTGQVHPYFPYTRIQVAADFVLFKPQQGSRIVGVVNKVGDTYVGLLIMGFMNAAIYQKEMRSEFKANFAESTWASTKTPAHKLAIGDIVVFDVVKLERSGGYLSILGSLKESGTGNIAHVKLRRQPKKQQQQAAEQGNGTATKDKTSKKAKRKADDDNDEQPTDNKKDKTASSKEEKKKRKDKDAGGESGETKKKKKAKTAA